MFNEPMYITRIGLLFLSFFILTIIPNSSLADCSCNPSNGIHLYGMEFIAKSCAVAGDDDNTVRRYVIHYLICENQKIVDNPTYTPSEGNDTAAHLTATAQSYNFTRILRNKEGTHFIAAHRYYSGTVAGISPPKAVTIIDNLNEYCTDDGGLPDVDGDHFPDCLDCNPKDPDLNEVCPVNIEKNLGKPDPSCPTP